MKQAAALKKNGKIYIYGESQTIDGIWTANNDMFIMHEGDSEKITSSIIAALESSRSGLPNVSGSEWKEAEKSFVASLGSKDFPSFMKNSKCVHISQEQGEYFFMPTANGGKKKGYTPLEGVLKSNEASDNLADLLMRAFERST